jgi:hypothetical protein
LWTRWLHSWRGSVASGCESQHVDFARISGTVTAYPQGASLCAILVIDPGDRRYDHGDRHGDRGDPGGQGVGRQGRRGARKLAWDYTTSTLLSASIHPTSENCNFANFAFKEFCELRLLGILGSSSSKDMETGAKVQNEKAPPRLHSVLASPAARIPTRASTQAAVTEPRRRVRSRRRRSHAQQRRQCQCPVRN